MQKIIVFIVTAFMLLAGKISLAQADTYVSLENVFTGYLVTEYYDSEGAKQYAYPAFAYSSSEAMQRRQNYTLDYTAWQNAPAVEFRNTQTGRCLTYSSMTSVVSGRCGLENGTHWEMIYTSTGAIQLKNFANGLCLVSTDRGSTYANLAFTSCAKNGASAYADALWIVTAPRLTASVSY
jgi:hypothetical protein